MIPTEKTSEQIMADMLLQTMDKHGLLAIEGRPFFFPYPDDLNVHRIKLEDDFSVWNKGTYYIFKKNFFGVILAIPNRDLLSGIIQNRLELDIKPRIPVRILEKALIVNTQNNRIFESFIMLKILEERFYQANPANSIDAERYQLNPFHRSFSNYENELIGSLWPMVNDSTKWCNNPSPDYETISLIINGLQGIIAQIAINSTFEAIALQYVMQKQEPPDSLGLCDLSKIDLNEIITNFINATDKSTLKTMDNWLKTSNPSPLTETISKLLNASLEVPPNIPKFLNALNLKEGSAKEECDIYLPHDKGMRF